MNQPFNMQDISATSIKQKSAAKTILGTGLIAGTLDAIAAIVVYQANPGNVFKYIAGGAFGLEAAFSGGAFMIIMGVLFHYFIATTWTFLYFIIYPKLKVHSGNKYVNGIIYGIFVWCMMNLVVLRLSQIPTAPLQFGPALISIAIIIFMIGLPISILTHRHYSNAS